MMCKCMAAGHTYDYQRLMQLKPRMQQLTLNEKQPGNTTSFTVWVYPEVLEALRQKYPQNLQTTLCSYLTSLADPDTLIIEGENARALHETGVLRGRDIRGLGEIMLKLEKQVAEAKVRESALGPLMQMMAAFQGGGQGLPGARPAAAAAGATGDYPSAPPPPIDPTDYDPFDAAMVEAEIEPVPEPQFHGKPRPTPGQIR